MATFRSEMKRAQRIIPDPGADETAAILAALAAYMESQDDSGTTDRANGVERWRAAGRLEALGISVSRERLDRGWRV